MKSVSTLFCLSFLLHACTKPITISIPQAKPKLTVFSQIIPNKIVMVGVTRSFSGLSDFDDVSNTDTAMSGILVSRALATITHHGITDTLYKLSDGLYGSVDVQLLPYETYELNIYDSTSGEAVHALTEVKPLVQDSISIHVDRKPNDTVIYFQVNIQDNPSTEDYYYIDVASNGKSEFLEQANKYYDKLSTNAAVYIMSDREAVNGVIVKEFDNSGFLNAVGPNDSVTIVVSNISRSYYQFIDAYNRGNSLFSQLFGEPVNFPTNIVNGYGLFTAHLPKIYFLDMKDY
jgi:hypothetical protein